MITPADKPYYSAATQEFYGRGCASMTARRPNRVGIEFNQFYQSCKKGLREI